MKNIEKILLKGWKRVKDRRNRDEMRRVFSDLGVDKIGIEFFVQRLYWEMLNFSKEPKRTIRIAGMYGDKTYLICKKCKSFVVKQFPFDDNGSMICPLCNNIKIPALKLIQKNDRTYKYFTSIFNTEITFSKIKLEVKCFFLRIIVIIQEKFHDICNR